MKITVNIPDEIYLNIISDNLSMREMQIILSCLKKDCYKYSPVSRIQIGDVLKYTNELDDPDALEFIVTYIDADGKSFDCICPDGACYQNIDIQNMSKTGRWVDVTKLCNMLGGEEIV